MSEKNPEPYGGLTVEDAPRWLGMPSLSPARTGPAPRVDSRDLARIPLGELPPMDEDTRRRVLGTLSAHHVPVAAFSASL